MISVYLAAFWLSFTARLVADRLRLDGKFIK